MPKTCRRWAKFSLRKAFFLAGFLLPLLTTGIAVVVPQPVRAQAVPGGSADLLNQLRQQYGQQGSGASQDFSGSGQGNVIVQAVPAQNGPSLPQSRLEQILSARAGTKLEQFGYEQLGRGHNVTMAQTGAVQDDYVLGPGDQIIVSLRGQENNELRAEVNRNGQIVLPRLAPIPATGRNFGDFRQDLQAAVHRAYVATEASVSVGRVRQINVLVSGEVNVPGQRILTGLSSVVDAILISGGIKKTGSLRNIRIQRGSQQRTVDLYSVLTSGGTASDLRLADGDRIVVPPLGRTMAVSGLVRQPGIFELTQGQAGMSARALLALAGGQEVRGRYRLSVLRIDAQGNTNLNALGSEAEQIKDSEILFVQFGADQTASQATLSGGTGLAGGYPVASGTKLSDMLKAPGAMGPSPYTLFGIVVRKDPGTLLRTLAAFTPVAVLNNREDMNLQSDDFVRPISVGEASLLSNVVRAYLEKLAADQAILRNPLVDQNIVTSATRPALPNAGGLPQTVATLPVSKVDELSFALDDLASAPPDVQRADIISLMELRAPGTLDVGSQEALLEKQDQTGLQHDIRQDLAFQAGNGTVPVVPPMANAAGVGTNPQAALPNGAMAYPPYSAYGAGPMYGAPGSIGNMNFQQPSVPQPAQNFQETPLSAGRFAANREIKTFGELVRQLNVDPLILINFLIEHRARLDGAVRGPGSYFVGPNVTLNDMVQAAGGTLNWADESGIELITTAVDHQTGKSVTRQQSLSLRQPTLASYVVRPRDTLRFNQVFTNAGIGAVTIQGEVRFAGSYPITRGEHLSDLLMRAGGLTNTAYPAGSVFLRKSAAAAEHEGYLRAANEIENELVIAMTRVGNDKIDPGTFGSMQAFVNELRNQKAVGRVAIVADPSMLVSRPEMDPLLEAGDVLYIPQRPSTIAVLGQVMQPGSFPYRAGKTLEDYIEQAGGYAATSDESLTFIVLPDGSARRVQKSWLSFDAQDLPPGSTIVVPRDVTPLNTRQLILDVSSIFSQFAVSIASMAVLAKQ
ncbi:MAG: SLBB domain-containing protein [Alphaproteobacteria bacterium]|nr:SLBB domain-containing protein [Alphaproteobacteria bacterium]